MTPKEKAKYLISIHSLTMLGEIGNKLTMHELKDIAKQCALIAVDEIIEVCDSYVTPYYYEVKKEIEKL
jgi:hypothetical protein